MKFSCSTRRFWRTICNLFAVKWKSHKAGTIFSQNGILFYRESTAEYFVEQYSHDCRNVGLSTGFAKLLGKPRETRFWTSMSSDVTSFKDFV